VSEFESRTILKWPRVLNNQDTGKQRVFGMSRNMIQIAYAVKVRIYEMPHS